MIEVTTEEVLRAWKGRRFRALRMLLELSTNSATCDTSFDIMRGALLEKYRKEPAQWPVDDMRADCSMFLTCGLAQKTRGMRFAISDAGRTLIEQVARLHEKDPETWGKFMENKSNSISQRMRAVQTTHQASA